MTAVPSRTRSPLAIAALLSILAAAFLLAQPFVPSAPAARQQAAAGGTSYSAELSASSEWKDTGLDLQPGDNVQITASGQFQYSDARQSTGPQGLPRGWKDLTRIFPLNDAGRGALIARIGSDETSRPLVIGESHTFRAPVAGRLFLGINQTSSDSADGSYHVEVKILERGSASTTPPSAVGTSVDGFTLDILDKIPRRNSDSAGDPGDMTNFILIGPEDRLKQAFQQAGWVIVDRTKQDAVLHGLVASLSKQSYVEMPMSELYLFGRPQDYGFALAAPYEVVYTRHHNRVWKSDYTVGGQPVWVGAGTHDTGIERDQRTAHGITHKIDPEIDKERDFIAQSLIATGLVTAKMYLTPSQPVGEARTATGGGFHSDGRVLVLDLRATAPAASPASSPAPGREVGALESAPFSAVFCSVLEREHPDSGSWGPCSEYIEAPSRRRVALGPISRKYRVAIVSGVLTACGGSSTAFREGRAHMRSAYGISVDLIPAPNGSSAANGESIARYLRENYRRDSRKFILLGYSKGAVDILEGLANDPEAARAVAALITVAGAIGGSPIADLMPAQAQQWFNRTNSAGCKGDLYSAFRSLRRDVRRDFLALHPDPGVPVYSLAAVSDRAETSRILLEGWLLLSFYGQPEDSQLLESDTRFPGGHDLGAVRADHIAVALPFENSSDPAIRGLVNHNHFPRTTLLEALIRFVVQDLHAAPSLRVSHSG